MDDIESIISQNGEISFEEAIKYFGDKIPVTAEQFANIASEYKSIAFTISGYTRVQVVKKFQEELLKAIEDGDTMETFRKNMNAFLEDNGYEGITNFQADNIFRTNVQTAYQVGHYRQMTEPTVKKLRPYWMYDAVHDSHTRPSHLAMDGKVFPADSKVWDTWYPPNGFRCRCTVRSLSKRQVEQMGLKVETEAPVVEELSDGRFVTIMPDPNFSTNPAKMTFHPDLKGYPDILVKAYQEQMNLQNEI